MLLLACSNVISRKYEYEEEVFLALDGSATVYVNASVPALVALRGAKLPLDPKCAPRSPGRARFLRDAGHARRQRDDLAPRGPALRSPAHRRRRHQPLSEAAPFAWSTYRFQPRDGELEYTQSVLAAAGQDVGNVGWQGDELVAVRMHLPSKVTYENAPGGTERGNIVVWEQPLADRLKGVPLEVQVRMQTESILFRTLTLFGAMMAAVVVTFAAAIWFVKTRKVETGAGNHEVNTRKRD